MTNLNTSHVKVKLEYVRILKNGVYNLNTSHVKVKLQIITEIMPYINNLNTSHVKVKHFSDCGLYNYKLFKYISC